jgi:hypothetical protein
LHTSQHTTKSGMATVVATDGQWLRGAPRCRAEGSAVYVTFALDPDRVNSPACIAWSAGGLHSTTPGIKGPSVTVCIPRTVFEHHAIMRLQVIGSAESESPVFAWTQIPVLEETMFRAEMAWDRPVLSPVMPPPQRRTVSHSPLSIYD